VPSGLAVSSESASQTSAPLLSLTPADARTRHARWPVLVALGIAVVLLVTGAFWITRRGIAVAPGPVASAAPPSVAVMPFIDLSPERNQEYFTLGLAEELVNGLGRLPDLRVAAYKLRRNEQPQAVDARSVGEQMHVGTVLQGSVTKAGDRVRIRVQLVKLPDAYNLWAETYDRRLDDIFAVQDEIARAVASALKVKLLAAAHSPNAGSPEAYNLVLQAQYLRGKGGRDGYEKALGLLQKAGSLDPTNARVFAELSRPYFVRATEGGDDADYGESWKAANHAVELNPGLADASFKKALALEPRNVRALRSAAALASAVGRFEEAITLGQRATELEPTNAQIYYNLCLYQRKGGQPDGAQVSCRRALELDPKLAFAHFQIGGGIRPQRKPGRRAAGVRPGVRRVIQGARPGHDALLCRPGGSVRQVPPGARHQAPRRFCPRDRADLRLAQREGQGLRVAGPGLCAARHRARRA
jgi:TolB-like protein